MLSNFTLWVVDEVSMVPQKHFENMVAQWRAVGSWPILLFVGDFAQLPPVGALPGDARSSALWRAAQCWDLGCGSFRSGDTTLLNFQALVRAEEPSLAELVRVLGPVHMGEVVSEALLLQMWHDLPAAVVVCATQQTVQQINLSPRNILGEKSSGSCNCGPCKTIQHLCRCSSAAGPRCA